MLTHAFNDREGLRIAVEMERRGEEFYRRSARISRNPQTVKVLEQLAALADGGDDGAERFLQALVQGMEREDDG